LFCGYLAFVKYIEIFGKYDKYIDISSLEVLTYGISARVSLFSQSERANAIANERVTL
jgi:hypothetical protein